MTRTVRDVGWLLLGVTAGLSITAVASPLPFPTIELTHSDVVPLAKAAVFVLLIGSARTAGRSSSRLHTR